MSGSVKEQDQLSLDESPMQPVDPAAIPADLVTQPGRSVGCQLSFVLKDA